MKDTIVIALALSGIITVGAVSLAAAIVEPDPVDCTKAEYDRSDWPYSPEAHRARMWTQSPWGAYSGMLFEQLPTGHEAEVDHIYPLHQAHTHGGCNWSPQMKRQFANDPWNLALTIPELNRDKSDSLTWGHTPAVRWLRYRQETVARKYQLPLPQMVRL